MRGAPAKAIQELASHSELGTTQHLSSRALESVIRLLDLPALPPLGGAGVGRPVLDARGEENARKISGIVAVRQGFEHDEA